MNVKGTLQAKYTLSSMNRLLYTYSKITTVFCMRYLVYKIFAVKAVNYELNSAMLDDM